MAATGASGPVLRRLLEAAGYRLEDRPVGLLAVRTSDRRAVLLVEGLRSPAELEDALPKGMGQVSLVYGEDPGPLARELASARGMEVLDAHSLGPALGELLLPGPERLPSGETPGPLDPLEPPAQLFPEGDRSLRVRVGAADAAAIAGIDGIAATLRLVPFYVASYRVRVATAQGTPGPATDHLVAVSALSGEVEVWDARERELATERPPGAWLLPALPETEARAAAEAAIRKRHTVSVDHTEQHGGAIVIERRRVAPGPGDLRVGTMALVHVPFWYLEGAEGRVVIDAVTGARTTASESEATDV